VLGTADDMRTMADALDRIDGSMAAIYAARTQLQPSEVARMMAVETFMSADEAVALGFADGLLENQAAVAPPRLSASAAPASKRDLEEQFRKLGFSRSIAARMTEAAWPAAGRCETSDSDLDFDAIATVIANNLAAHVPPHRFR